MEAKPPTGIFLLCTRPPTLAGAPASYGFDIGRDLGYMSSTMVMQAYLRGFYIFQDLKPGEFAGLGHIFRERRYPKGEYLFRQGGTPDRLFLIESGEVEIYREVGGQRQALARLSDGETIGEVSLFGGSQHSASAVAATDVVTCAAEGGDFARLLAENVPGIGKVMGRLMESTVRRFKLLEGRPESAGDEDEESAAEPESTTSAESRLMHAMAQKEPVRIHIATVGKAGFEALFHIIDLTNSMGVPLLRLQLTQEGGGREYIVPLSGVRFFSFRDATGKF